MLIKPDLDSLKSAKWYLLLDVFFYFSPRLRKYLIYIIYSAIECIPLYIEYIHVTCVTLQSSSYSEKSFFWCEHRKLHTVPSENNSVSAWQVCVMWICVWEFNGTLTAVMKLLGSRGSSCSLWKRTEDEDNDEEEGAEERNDEGSPLE